MSNPPTSHGEYSKHLDLKCDSCHYKITMQEGRLIDCQECGSYHICDYCFKDYKEKNDQEKEDEENKSELSEDYDEEDKKPKRGEMTCVYCWSKKTLTDM